MRSIPIKSVATIAFAMECFENGLLTEKDTGGIKLTFGNAEAMVSMVELIAKRQGIGDLLAEGSMRATKKIGRDTDRFAIQVKGQEAPMHEPRLKRALGLGYAVSSTGADHCHNVHDTGFKKEGPNLNAVKALGILGPISLEDLGPKKIRLYTYFTNWRVLNNCLLLCNFVPWDYHQIVEIVRAVTGWNTTAWELAKAGERAMNLARVFNIREGFTEKDDWLPERFFYPQTSGPLSKTAIDPQQLEKAKHTYYKMMGWDEQTGIPKSEKLEELDIAWVSSELARNQEDI